MESVETVEVGRELVVDKALVTLVILASIGEKKRKTLETVSNNEKSYYCEVNKSLNVCLYHKKNSDFLVITGNEGNDNIFSTNPRQL